uniref:Uncharacterized protein n=1 Tax=Anguilla anguilla TaxID=7936 RepID=A0A0E9UEY2_ANGAN
MMENFTALLCVMYDCKDLAQSLFYFRKCSHYMKKIYLFMRRLKYFPFI